MRRRILIAVWAVLAAVSASGVIWFYAAGNVGEPTEVTAPPITTAVPEPSGETAATAATTAAPVTSAAGEEEPAPGSGEAAPTTAGSQAPAETTTTTAASSDGAADPGGTVDLVLSEGTEARFLIFEELRGEPFTVVAATADVVGRVRVDPAELSASQMGEILINARTFVTDSSNRDRAIRGPILGAEQYEFISFRPTAIIGLSGAAEPGGEWSFTVEGDLTVREVTRPVAFGVTARWDGDGLVEGEASAAVLRSDFGLSVPSVPFVANVADDIVLELDFIARPPG